MLGSFEHSLSKTSRPVDDPRRRAVCHFGVHEPRDSSAEVAPRELIRNVRRLTGKLRAKTRHAECLQRVGWRLLSGTRRPTDCLVAVFSCRAH